MRRAPLLVCCFALCLAGCRTAPKNRIVVGSKNFTEQIVLAELLAQQIEERVGVPVERKVNLGGTLICHQALRAGEVDLYIEYTGTALTAVLGDVPTGVSRAVYERVKAGYAQRFGLELGEPLGFENTFAMVIRGEDARQFHLRTVSDLLPLASRWRIGVGYEFLERPDGFRGWTETYKLRFAAPPRVMDLGLLYRALKDRQVDVVAGSSTDGLIEALDLAVLEDDRGYFPPYDAVPIVRRDAFERFPQLRGVLRQLAGRVTAADMRRMNYAVDGERRDVAEVVRSFRRSRGL